MLRSTISMLRVLDARKSEVFFCTQLGFKKSWEYDPGNGEPVFLEVIRDNVAFHLSEHEGDGPLGVQVYVNVENSKALYDESVSGGAPVVGPPYESEWEHLVFTVEDLDVNPLRIGSPL